MPMSANPLDGAAAKIIVKDTVSPGARKADDDPRNSWTRGLSLPSAVCLQNADRSLRKNEFIVLFTIIFGALSFPI